VGGLLLTFAVYGNGLNADFPFMEMAKYFTCHFMETVIERCSADMSSVDMSDCLLAQPAGFKTIGLAQTWFRSRSLLKLLLF